MRSIVLLISVIAAAAVVLSGMPSVSAESSKPLFSGPIVKITDTAADIVVEVGSLAAFARVAALAAQRGMAVSFSSPDTGIVTLAVRGDDTAFVDALMKIAGVTTISSETKARTLFTPNDQYENLQWGLTPINAFRAWDISTGRHTVVVGVLDTGIDWNHPDLAPNIWNDSNGYHGYNFIANNRLPMDDNVNSYDENGNFRAGTYTYHGTHVAGIVGAVINNNIGVAGMAQVRLMAVKVMNDSGEGTDATVASGIRWAVDNGANIITMSLGVDGTSLTLESAINYAASHGVVAVAASGNSGSSFISYPAAYPGVIAVGATDNLDRRATFSNFGTGLDIMAPGVDIYSTMGGGGYQRLSGTSTAAPYVAGVAALMLSVNPVLTPVQIGAIINTTATDISRTGYDTSTGWGIVNAFMSVEQIASPTVTITEHPSYVTPNSTYSITWLVSGGNPGIISSTYLRWGSSPSSMTQTSQQFTGTTYATFTVDNLPALPQNGTIYLIGVAVVDGTTFNSSLLQIPVHDAPQQGLFTEFLHNVQQFIFNELGWLNFLLLLGALIAIPIILVAARSRRRRMVRAASPQLHPYAQLQSFEPMPAAHVLPPPPPPPPRYEAYVDVVGHEVMPAVMKVVEGTKIVWVNRTWAPPPGVSIRSGRIDQMGEHPDGMFQSGMLIAPGDYWSATFHRAGTYEYYLTGIWKTARIIVEPFRSASGASGPAAS